MAGGMTDNAHFQHRYGPWALIAGGSEGIGLSFAEQLAASGIHLVLLSRSKRKLEAAKARILGRHQVEVALIEADLCADECMAAIESTAGTREIGLLVYNAGAMHGAGLFHDGSVDQPLSLVSLNCRGPVLLAHRFGNAMRSRRRGGMLFVSSMAAFGGGSYMATYAATKAFDIIFAQSLWHEMAPFNVDVLALVAGATRTPAMAASGVDFKGEESGGFNIMEAGEVAREGLTHLRDGPVWIAGESNREAAKLMQQMPRRNLVELMSQAAATMYGKPYRPAGSEAAG